MQDDDSTVKLARPAGGPSMSRRLGWPLLAAFVAGVVAAGSAWFFLAPRPANQVAAVAPVQQQAPPSAPPVQTAFAPPAPTLPAPQPPAPALPRPPDAPPPPLAAPPPAAPQPAPLPPLLAETEILARNPTALEAYRFAPASEIMVLQFPKLADQARMLNRVAALVEKAGYPRDRVLPPAELDRRIRAEGAEPDSFYYGHDYRAADVVRFFDLLQESGQAPTDAEASLQAMMDRWGWNRGTNAALISLVAEDEGAGIGAATRATILRHELSHGLYFTSPAYARFSHDFFTGTLTQPERQKFRAFLLSEGYDTGIEDLVVNETQAYLMHTADGRFFNADAVGLPARRIDALRALFLTGMPPGWLRDCTTVTKRLPRRRGYRRSTVRRTRTLADRRAPERLAVSRAARRSRT